MGASFTRGNVLFHLDRDATRQVIKRQYRAKEEREGQRSSPPMGGVVEVLVPSTCLLVSVVGTTTATSAEKNKHYSFSLISCSNVATSRSISRKRTCRGTPLGL